ncbi:unnamed protein product [Lepeophtheirus salmonis]|uniref:(salmon louse) hypothetical protein n=1 Tax=Lepeophtheirus salmonis TaxID=72036 RepID=A0A7R8H144_LEPSM|nr:unnamed protein product [Lepeophtheirus salmonis]CAF2782042.1 unnamed protein product [Lepeophtheirus salmonis]
MNYPSIGLLLLPFLLNSYLSPTKNSSPDLRCQCEAPVPPENGGGEDPLAQQQQQAGAMGEAGVEGGEAPNAAGRVTGMAQGFLSKAMAAKDGMKEKEEEVPTPPEPNPPTDMGGEMMEGGEEIVQE